MEMKEVGRRTKLCAGEESRAVCTTPQARRTGTVEHVFIRHPQDPTAPSSHHSFHGGRGPDIPKRGIHG